MVKNFFSIKLVVWLALVSIAAGAQQGVDIESQVRKALNAPFRTSDDLNADSYRLPTETLAFLGLKHDMRVMELLPGGGYYTRILGQVLAENGKLYLGADGERVAPDLPKWGLNKVEILDDNFETERHATERYYNIVNDFEFNIRDLDMVLTFRNTHNFSKEQRIRLSEEVFKTLRSGGIFGVVGHTRRHMEPYDEARWRRVDPVELIKEMQDIGFIFNDYSDLHHRPADKLVHDTTHPHINRDSDRFTFIFTKP